MTIDVDNLYRRVGEYIVAFQWLEHRFRETGWLILDPERKTWPPVGLRSETNSALLQEVNSLYADLIDRLHVMDGNRVKQAFSAIVEQAHNIRKTRNRILHSAYTELKSGDVVYSLLRTNPRYLKNPGVDDLVWDQEILREDSFDLHMREIGEVGVALGMHYTQLLHWAPFPVGREYRTGIQNVDISIFLGTETIADRTTDTE